MQRTKFTLVTIFHSHIIVHPISRPLHLVTLELCPCEHLLPIPVPSPGTCHSTSCPYECGCTRDLL